MAKVQFYAYADCSVLANYLSWARGLSNAIAAVGWVRTSDSNQVNWSTITVAGTTASAPYEIWMSSDLLSSTSPMYLKIVYGRYTAYNVPYIVISVGTGSDGSGNLTGVMYTSSASTVAATDPATSLYECDVAGGPGWLTICMFRNYTSNLSRTFMLSLERAHTTSGADSSSYCTLLVAVGNSGTYSVVQQSMPLSAGGIVPPSEAHGLTCHTSQTNAGYSTQTAVVPFWPAWNGLDNPLINAVCIKAADFLDGSTFTASIYGTPHTYMALAAHAASWMWGDSTTNGIALRFE